MPDRCPRCGYKFSQDNSFRKKVREDYPEAFKPWRPDEDTVLEEGVKSGMSPLELSRKLGRQPTAIKQRIMKLELPMPVVEKEEPKPVEAPEDTRPL